MLIRHKANNEKPRLVRGFLLLGLGEAIFIF
jgi:hypothetical protein